MKHHFIKRNRIISGLSNALLVIEASYKSGTLHIVRFALEQGVPVLAVTGNISQPRSSGTNKLIAQGARITTDYRDIIDELGIAQHETEHHEIFVSNKEEDAILKLMQSGNDDGQLLLEASGLDSHVFQQTITMLGISSKIQTIGASRWSIR